MRVIEAREARCLTDFDYGGSPLSSLTPLDTPLFFFAAFISIDFSSPMSAHIMRACLAVRALKTLAAHILCGIARCEASAVARHADGAARACRADVECAHALTHRHAIFFFIVDFLSTSFSATA
jgi:hypothetical protein